MTKQVDINCDMGESFGMYKMGLDEEVISSSSDALLNPFFGAFFGI